VGADLLVELPVGLGLVGQGDDVGDLEAVRVLVLERAVEALDDAVRLGRVVAGPDVTQLRMAGDEVEEVGALVGQASQARGAITVVSCPLVWR
jgi:hypothetical protein